MRRIHQDGKTPGQVAFEAYSVAVGGRAFNGDELPRWAQVVDKTPRIRDAWEEAARQVRVQHQREIAERKIR